MDTTPTHHPNAKAGADKVLIQCIQSVHFEVHLDVHNEHLHHLWIPRYHAPTHTYHLHFPESKSNGTHSIYLEVTLVVPHELSAPCITWEKDWGVRQQHT